jgi:hypothetical protein
MLRLLSNVIVLKYLLWSLADEYSSHNETTHFFEELGSGSLDEVADETMGGDDADFEKKQEVRTF